MFAYAENHSVGQCQGADSVNRAGCARERSGHGPYQQVRQSLSACQKDSEAGSVLLSDGCWMRLCTEEKQTVRRYTRMQMGTSMYGRKADGQTLPADEDGHAYVRKKNRRLSAVCG